MKIEPDSKYEGPTELALYITPGNISKLFRVRTGLVFPHEDLLTPPEPSRIGVIQVPVDRAAPTWKVRLDEEVYEFGEDAKPDRRRVRVVYQKGPPPPSKEWVARAIDNLMHTVH